MCTATISFRAFKKIVVGYARAGFVPSRFDPRCYKYKAGSHQNWGSHAKNFLPLKNAYCPPPRILYAAMMKGLVVILIALCTTIASASQASHAAVQFRAEVEQWADRAHAFPIPERSHLVLEIFYGRKPVPHDEIERLERLAPHDRNYEHELRLARSINQHGGERERVDIYFENESLWRINVEYLTYSAIEYSDSAKGKDRVWLLTPGQVQVGSASRGLQPVDRQFMAISTVVSYLTDWRTAILGKQRPQIDDVVVQEGRASFTVAREDRNLRIRGRFDPSTPPSLNTLHLETIGIVDPSGAPLGRIAFSDWRFNPHLGRVLPYLFESFNADGGTQMTVKVMGVTSLTMDIHALTATPARPDGEDPVRGPFTFTSIYDHTQNEAALFDAESGLRLSSQSLGTFSGYRRHVIAGLIMVVGVSIFVCLHKRSAQ